MGKQKPSLGLELLINVLSALLLGIGRINLKSFWLMSKEASSRIEHAPASTRNLIREYKHDRANIEG